MDVILNAGFVNWLLGGVYAYVAAMTAYYLYLLNTCTTYQYTIITSKKSAFLSYFYLVFATCVTVSYQNFFGDTSHVLLWWRLLLIGSIGSVVTRMSYFASRVRKIVPNDV